MNEPEEMEIMITKARILESKGKVEEAIAALSDVKSRNLKDFIRSRTAMASLYLKRKRDRRLYIGCFQEIFERDDGVHSCIMLGDAYMAVLEVRRFLDR